MIDVQDGIHLQVPRSLLTAGQTYHVEWKVRWRARSAKARLYIDGKRVRFVRLRLWWERQRGHR